VSDFVPYVTYDPTDKTNVDRLQTSSDRISKAKQQILAAIEPWSTVYVPSAQEDKLFLRQLGLGLIVTIHVCDFVGPAKGGGATLGTECIKRKAATSNARTWPVNVIVIIIINKMPGRLEASLGRELSLWPSKTFSRARLGQCPRDTCLKDLRSGGPI
jgi:hypothetical protein